MLQVNYTEEAKEKISQFRYHYPDPRIQKHFEMLWLHACGIRVPEIARLTGTNPYTVRGIVKKYRDGGMEEVVKTNDHRPQSSLEQYKTSIIEEFTKRPLTTSHEAAHRIKQLFGVERPSQRVRIFMKKLGMKFQRTGSVPAKADLEQQEEFKKTLEPVISRAKAGECVVVFMEAAHFVQGVFCCCLWCFTRVFIRSSLGRRRWNVLGAYHVITGQLTTIANDSYINSATICEMLHQLAKEYAGREIVEVCQEEMFVQYLLRNF